MARLLEIDFPASGEDVERFAEARAFAHGEPLAQERFKRGRVSLAQRTGARHLVAQLGGHLVRRRRRVDRRPVEGRSRARVADGGELVGLDDERAQIARLQDERLVDGLERGAMIAAPGAG